MSGEGSYAPKSPDLSALFSVSAPVPSQDLYQPVPGTLAYHQPYPQPGQQLSYQQHNQHLQAPQPTYYQPLPQYGQTFSQPPPQLQPPQQSYQSLGLNESLNESLNQSLNLPNSPQYQPPPLPDQPQSPPQLQPQSSFGASNPAPSASHFYPGYGGSPQYQQPYGLSYPQQPQTQQQQPPQPPPQQPGGFPPNTYQPPRPSSLPHSETELDPSTGMPPRRAAAAAAAAIAAQQGNESSSSSSESVVGSSRTSAATAATVVVAAPVSSVSSSAATAVAPTSSSIVVAPSPVKTKFPTARIKRIMQADEEVGKVSQQTPIAVGKALELFMIALVSKSADVARSKNSKRVSAPMLKQVVESDDQWDFLRDIVKKVDPEEKHARATNRNSVGGGGEGGSGTKTKLESDSEEEQPKKRGRPGRKKKV